MEYLPDYTSPTERAYFASSPECSKAYDAAEQVLFILKNAKENFTWCAANKKCSQNIYDRWEGIKSWCDAMKQRAEKYSPTIAKEIDSDLEEALEALDQENVNYDPDYRKESDLFSYELNEYAEIIIRALKKDMGDDEAELFDNNR